MSDTATVNVAGALIGASLREAIIRLRRFSESARLEAELMLSPIVGLNRVQLRTHDAQLLSTEQRQAFDHAVSRRERGEPIAYILGEQEFWSLRLRVTPAVLVPRPETELLVEWSLECVKQRSHPALADLGTGSGAIAIALAHERIDAAITATDCSIAALDIARENAQALDLGHIAFRRGHWLEPLAGQRFDVLVSNPPYIAEGDAHLPALRYEPQGALTSGADGLDAIRHLVQRAPGYLNPNGWLLLEHGATQALAVRALFAQRGYADVTTRNDLAGLERATGARWPART